jgi:hypothetical protein
VLLRGGVGCTANAVQRRARLLQRKRVEAALRGIERGVDAIDFFFQQHVGGTPLDGGQALVVRLAKRLESPHQVVVRRGDAGLVLRRGGGNVKVHKPLLNGISGARASPHARARRRAAER